MKFNDATLAQIRAADPTASTWLSANAGSGKTRVLTDRVARLLLDGVSPQNILCLTYTKAAASEMQNRLFKRLGEWAMKDDDSLTKALAELGVEGTRDLSLARQLFARAIETPGGLKIQTIHAYCASLLRRFPTEAGVSPQFTEMDDRAANDLRARILEQLSDGPHKGLVQDLAQLFTGEDLTRLTAGVTSARMLFGDAKDAAQINNWFGLAAGDELQAVLQDCFAPEDLELLTKFHAGSATGSAQDQKRADALQGADLSQPNLDLLQRLEKILLLQKPPYSAKIGSVPTKSLQTGALAPIMDQLNDLMTRVEDARHKRLALHNARRTQVLYRFAHVFVQEYEAAKLARGWLDFDDLILKAGGLLTDPSVAAWVLFKLDGGIDHILVDEAQDTSPVQWRVIDSLAREFTTGSGARDDIERTIFVVGDPKQSIYSFQGAEPAEFQRMQHSFADRLQQVGRALAVQPLEYSFRSSPAVLGFVDMALEGRSGLGGSFKHRAFFGDKPGRVDLWPPIEPVKHEEDRDWNDPVDRPSPRDHRVQLADNLADEIQRMIREERLPDDKGGSRPVDPGDILVLVRSRSELFHELIRACKARDIPIAGADQLRIGAELAVKDLTALLSFLATPEDDLSLATVLRSPLFGWSEDDLFRLAHYRDKKTFLWRALSDDEDQYSATLETLHDLRDRADFLRPYELLERILTRHGGRRKLLARLGQEAEDGIDALLHQAMNYERSEIPSLTGFISWLESGDITIKRQVDSKGHLVRVMTIHGSKGLEAPIVLLPDLAARRASDPPQIGKLAQDRPFWFPSKPDRTEAIEGVAEDLKEAEIEERTRLLYVAMTRAEQWLILAAAGDLGKADTGWYRVCETAMEMAGGATCEFPTGTGKRYATGEWPDLGVNDPTAQAISRNPLPEWLTTQAAPPVNTPKPLSPSDLGGAKALPGEAELAGSHDPLVRGRQIHLLLEHLPTTPADRWEALAQHLLSSGPDAAEPDVIRTLTDEVSALLTDPALTHLFDGNSIAEAPITGRLPDAPHQILHGYIDRLIVTDDRVLVVDFKSNRLVPTHPDQTPEGLLRQMGAYRWMLQAIYPHTPIHTAILWTQTRELMALDTQLVDDAFGRLDAGGLAT
ncbi:DNA helicase/exodeoxyribonuclease V, subunit A [Aliiroseovarius halocynthiae]|uniref:DNA 3'-5' helicase n=1 Tax=Aliiroseovarius halocynthiae TaxID=985055 RepID=A0A545SNN2_9RHOB|nr:double-strand break repair helicase AddA [Aliiroseovarius halocynthiae]TQV66567.1 double-strand break repair helicase AddA [Aliiroseovarius halocynthiae]SMR82565.1 DNA helicase/exodeoxyribonuclease V, subunit A [Aliiroseovarius halocynthiae]